MLAFLAYLRPAEINSLGRIALFVGEGLEPRERGDELCPVGGRWRCVCGWVPPLDFVVGEWARHAVFRVELGTSTWERRDPQFWSPGAIVRKGALFI